MDDYFPPSAQRDLIDQPDIPILFRGYRFLFRTFTSMPVALYFLGILGLLSAIGSFIPQLKDLTFYIDKFSLPAGYEGWPQPWRMILFLGLEDLYHSPLFFLFLTLFSCSVLTCTIVRLRSIYQKTLDPNLEISPGSLNHSKYYEKLIMPAGTEKWIQAYPRLESTLYAERFFIRAGETPNHRIYYFSRGMWGIWGAYVVHLSILLILVGGTWGYFQGFSHAGYGKEGEIINIPTLGEMAKIARFRKLYLQYQIAFTRNPEASDTAELKNTLATIEKEVITLRESPHYQIRVDRLERFSKIISSTGAEQVDDWVSHVTVFDPIAGQWREAGRSRIEVNHPMRYRGVSVYQADWKEIPDAIDQCHFSLVESAASPTQRFDFSLKPGETTAVKTPSGVITVTLKEFFNNLTIGKDKQPTNKDESMSNPAAVMLFDRPGEKTISNVLFLIPELKAAYSPTFGPCKIEFEDITTKREFVSGLQMTMDPGANLTFLGFLFLFVGLILCFQVPFRWYYLLLPKNGDTVAHLAADSYKAMVDLEEEFDLLQARVKYLGAIRN